MPFSDGITDLGVEESTGFPSTDDLEDDNNEFASDELFDPMDLLNSPLGNSSNRLEASFGSFDMSGGGTTSESQLQVPTATEGTSDGLGGDSVLNRPLAPVSTDMGNFDLYSTVPNMPDSLKRTVSGPASFANMHHQQLLPSRLPEDQAIEGGGELLGEEGDSSTPAPPPLGLRRIASVTSPKPPALYASTNQLGLSKMREQMNHMKANAAATHGGQRDPTMGLSQSMHSSFNPNPMMNSSSPMQQQDTTAPATAPLSAAASTISNSTTSNSTNNTLNSTSLHGVPGSVPFQQNTAGDMGGTGSIHSSTPSSMNPAATMPNMTLPTNMNMNEMNMNANSTTTATMNPMMMMNGPPMNPNNTMPTMNLVNIQQMQMMNGAAAGMPGLNPAAVMGGPFVGAGFAPGNTMNLSSSSEHSNSGSSPMKVGNAMEKLCESMKRSAMTRSMVKQISSRGLSRQSSLSGSQRGGLIHRQGSSRSLLTKQGSSQRNMMLQQQRLSSRNVVTGDSSTAGESTRTAPIRRMSNSTKHHLSHHGRGMYRHDSQQSLNPSSSHGGGGNSNHGINLHVDGQNLGTF